MVVVVAGAAVVCVVELDRSVEVLSEFELQAAVPRSSRHESANPNTVRRIGPRLLAASDVSGDRGAAEGSELGQDVRDWPE